LLIEKLEGESQNKKNNLELKALGNDGVDTFWEELIE
jgi:hypothetical protein